MEKEKDFIGLLIDLENALADEWDEEEALRTAGLYDEVYELIDEWEDLS